MPKFMFAFHGGKMPENEQAIAEIMQNWGVWMEGLGAAIIDPGSILGESQTVSNAGISDASGATNLTGYMIVEAQDQATAVAMAESCPILENQGMIEVAPFVDS